MDIMFILYTLIPMVASSDDEGGGELLPLLLLLSGFVFYFYVVARYRNADKRHSHEAETEATVDNLWVIDQLLEHRKGLKNAKMNGANQLRIEGAQNKAGGSSKLLDSAKGMFKEV